LCKTSNPSSKDLQDLKLASGQLLYEKVASVCSKWNDDSTAKGTGPCVGLVVGATDLPALENIRKLNSNAWILCPGVGAQGGDAMDVCNVGLRSDGSGLLVSVSRGISKAADMGKAAAELRDDINKCRSSYLAQSVKSSSSIDLEEYQRSFIQFALSRNVLQFGSFKLKSGRISPYFFNAGLFCDGQSMRELSRSYAMAIRRTGLQFDVIFGPAYKGIPLATAVAVAWFDLYGENKDVSYNRKEAKDHGEGGVLVGATIEGKRVLIVDDVITAGTAIREAVDILNHAKANIVGVTVALDRQERATDAASTSAIQEVEREYGFPVVSIVQLKHLVVFASADHGEGKYLESILEYRQKYGVQY
jgi:orotate phosphoribosyltransferase